MITIDCPFCDEAATTDSAVAAVTCEGCGVTVDVAPDALSALDAAA